MYTLVGATLREKGFNKRFTEVDIGRKRMSELLDQYSEGYIELSNTTLKSNTFITLDTLRHSDRYVYSNTYFNDWLVTQGNLTIFGSTQRPKIYEEGIRYSDAFQAGCVANRVHPSDIEMVNLYPADMKTDIYLTKTLSDSSLMAKYALVFVNGYAHIQIPKARGILIKGGGLTSDNHPDCHIGILSFENVGELEFKKLDDTNIIVDKRYPCKHGVYVNLKTNLSGRTPILSVAGRVLFDHDLVSIINPSTGLVRLNLNRLDLFKMVIESIGEIDLTSLDLDERTYKTGSLTRDDVESDDCVLAILKLLQSFMVIVDKPYLLYEIKQTMTPKITGFYEMGKQTYLPYIADNGLLHPYWKMFHFGYYNSVYRFHLRPTHYNNPINETGLEYNDGDWLNQNHRIDFKPIFNSGYLIDCRYQVMEYK